MRWLRSAWAAIARLYAPCPKCKASPKGQCYDCWEMLQW